MSVTSVKNTVWLMNAEAIQEVFNHRERFPKNVSQYVVLNLFGKNLVSTEGPEWRAHRKVASPGFSEHNNQMMFRESINQAHGMIGHWFKEGNEKSSLTIKSLPQDTMRVTLNALSAVAFGVRLLWPGEKLQGEVAKGMIYYPDVPTEGHTLSFQRSLEQLLQHLFLILIMPKVILRYAPFKVCRDALEAYNNYKGYCDEMLEKKTAAVEAGEKVEGMDLMTLLVSSPGDDALRNAEKSKEVLAFSKIQRDGLSHEDILGNVFIITLAGHETTANTAHFLFVYLAMKPDSQRRVQADVDKTFNGSPPETWEYDCVNVLLGNMVGASFNEMLRVLPPVMSIPKTTRPGREETITINGEKKIIPADARVYCSSVSVHRNLKYWPSLGPSKITGKAHDLEDFVPERWFVKQEKVVGTDEDGKNALDAEFGGSTGTDSSAKLFRPIPGSYIPFSGGLRSCLGRRLAQVEVMTVMSVVYQRFSIELAVDEWATDEEVERMTDDEKRAVYAKAVAKARKIMMNCTTMVTLKLHDGQTYMPVRVVKRGEERFIHLIE